jgi:hypothetical protein
MADDDYFEDFTVEPDQYEIDKNLDEGVLEIEEPERYVSKEGIIEHESYDLNDRDEWVRLQHGLHREAKMQGMSHEAAAEVWASLTDNADQNQLMGSEILEDLVIAGYTPDLDTDTGPSYDMNLD